jgi:hypothetical protein
MRAIYMESGQGRRNRNTGRNENENNETWILLVLLVLILACGLGFYLYNASGAGVETDASTTDASTTDASTTDASTTASTTDASTTGGVDDTVTAGDDALGGGTVGESAADAAGCTATQYYESPVQSAASDRGSAGGCVDNIPSCQPWETLVLYGADHPSYPTRTAKGTLLKMGANKCNPTNLTVYCGAQVGAVKSGGLAGAARCVIPYSSNSITTKELQTIVPIHYGSTNIDNGLGSCPSPTSSQDWKVKPDLWSTVENKADLGHGATNITVAIDSSDDCSDSDTDSESDFNERCTVRRCQYTKK